MRTLIMEERKKNLTVKIKKLCAHYVEAFVVVNKNKI